MVAQGYNMGDKLYRANDAAEYLDIPLEDFLTYTNVKAQLCYRLLFGTRVYTEKELDRFKKEVLDGK